MKLWQRKKKWINEVTKKLCNTYIWNAFFPKTTRKLAYIAWNLRDQKNFEQNKYTWLNGNYYVYGTGPLCAYLDESEV